MAGEAKSATTAEVARAYFEAIGHQDIDAAAALWDPSGLDRIVGMVEMQAPGGFRSWFSELFAAFPDFRFEVLDQRSAGPVATTRWRATGRFDGTGTFQGMVPNGRHVEIEGCDVTEVREGKIVANHAYVNGADLARQLGTLPAEGSPAERLMLGAFNALTRARQRLQR